MMTTRATTPSSTFVDDELPEQHAEGRGLHRVRMDCQEVIAEGALLVVTRHLGLQNLLPALRARHHEGHGAPSSMVGAGWRPFPAEVALDRIPELLGEIERPCGAGRSDSGKPRPPVGRCGGERVTIGAVVVALADPIRPLPHVRLPLCS